jgi:hypothetical protein
MSDVEITREDMRDIERSEAEQIADPGETDSP